MHKLLLGRLFSLFRSITINNLSSKLLSCGFADQLSEVRRKKLFIKSFLCVAVGGSDYWRSFDVTNHRELQVGEVIASGDNDKECG
jgi:hypothetical protein